MINEQQLDLFKQGRVTARNTWREEHPGTAEPCQNGAREPVGGR